MVCESFVEKKYCIVTDRIVILIFYFHFFSYKECSVPKSFLFEDHLNHILETK